MAESCQLCAQQQPAWAPSAEERWFMEGHRWNRQVGWKGRMVQSPPHITSTLFSPSLSNSPSGLTLYLFSAHLCVRTSSSLSFTVHSKNPLHTSCSGSNGRQNRTVDLKPHFLHGHKHNFKWIIAYIATYVLDVLISCICVMWVSPMHPLRRRVAGPESNGV